MKDSSEVMFAAAFFAIAGPLAVIVAVVWHSLPIWLLWNWFAVPIGAPAIGFAWAVGIGCLATSFLAVPGKGEAEQWALWLRPPLLIAVGWVAKQFM